MSPVDSMSLLVVSLTPLTPQFPSPPLLHNFLNSAQCLSEGLHLFPSVAGQLPSDWSGTNSVSGDGWIRVLSALARSLSWVILADSSEIPLH